MSQTSPNRRDRPARRQAQLDSERFQVCPKDRLTLPPAGS